MILAHRIALKPNKSQANGFTRACGVSRFTYNWALAQCIEHYRATGKSLNLNELKRRWNQEKPAWVYESPRDANSQPFADLNKAFHNFFRELKKGNKKAGLPTFKKKGKSRDSFYLANDKFWVKGKLAKIPVIGKVKLTEELRFYGTIKHGTISREADRWFLSIAVEGEFDRERTGQEIVGVDLGVKALATLSTGEAIIGPKPLKAAQKKLARMQRQHSRKKKGSRNRAKSAMKVARMHRRIKNIRMDALHKFTDYLCKNHATVVIEDLHVKGMMKNHCLARAVSDMGFATFRFMLEYKAKLYGTDIIIADRWYPSSKTCSCCGKVKATLALSEREYVCDHCGFTLDRDLNAALNLKAVGLTALACGQPGAGAISVA
jgi:putative transposase